MKSGLLTRNECNALRGIAILGIILHNYSHWLNGIVTENEFLFFQHNVDALNSAMTHPDGNMPLHLLSFFGHYGVPIFLFLSGYGLVRKYEENMGMEQGARSFLWSHFKKLFLLMIPGFVAFVMVDAITPDPHKYHLLDVVAQLGMVNNLRSHPDWVIWPGPYWFFGLMMQLYMVYRLLLYRRHWGWTLALMVVCTLAQLLMDPEGAALNRYRYNCMGSMLPFGLGLLYARMPMTFPKGYNWLLLIISVVLVYFLGQNCLGWMWVPMFVCSAAFAMAKVLPECLSRCCEWLGGISAALFVVHPIIRKVFIPVSEDGEVYTGLLLYIVACIVVATLWHRLARQNPR